MFSLKRTLAVTRKEFQELIRNWMGFMLSIVAPVILYFLFAYGMPLDVKNIPLAVYDRDRSTASRSLLDCFVNSKVFQLKAYLERYEDIELIMRQGNIRACVIIPKNFSLYIAKGQPQSIQAIVEATYTNRASLVGGYIEAALADFNQSLLSGFITKKWGNSGASALPVAMQVSPWFNSTLRSEDFIVPGVIAIILIFLPPILAALAIAKEKETGSILNMYCSPVGKAEFIIGKAIPYITLTYFNFVLYYIFTLAIFKVPMRGDALLLFGVTLIYVITVIGIGQVIAVLVSTQIAAILITAVVTLIPSFMYSGFMIPVICMDQNARSTALSLPTTYYIDFIRKLMLKGVGISYLYWDIVTLCLMAVAIYAVAILTFKKKLG